MNLLIHMFPLIHLVTSVILVWGAEHPEPIPVILDTRLEYTLDECPVHNSAPHTHIHTLIFT